MACNGSHHQGPKQCLFFSNTFLQEEYHKRMSNSRENEWRERARAAEKKATEAEKQAHDFKMILRAMEETSDSDEQARAQLLAGAEEASRSEREMKGELQRLKSCSFQGFHKIHPHKTHPPKMSEIVATAMRLAVAGVGPSRFGKTRKL